MPATKAVFLDRDNTIIHNDGDLGDPDMVRLVRGAANAIASLRTLGYRVVVVSNQGGVARGKYAESDVDAVHQRIAELVYETSGGLIDRFYYCPFHPEGTVEQYRQDHPWRKPQPGMLLQAAEDLDLDLVGSWMVGDQERDIEAGLAAGCQTILISRDARVATRAHFRAETLAEAASIIAQHKTRPRTLRVPEPPSAEPVMKSWATGVAEPPREAPGSRRDGDGGEATERRSAGDATATVGWMEEDPDQPSVAVAAEDAADRSATDQDDAEAASKVAEPSASTIEVAPRPAPARPAIAQRAPTPPRAEPASSRPANESTVESRVERQLAEVLAELKTWRQARREFTPGRMMAVLASIAVLLLGVGVATYVEPARALAWVGVLVLGQITILVLHLLVTRT